MKELIDQIKTDRVTNWGIKISAFLLVIELILSITSFFFFLPPLIPVYNQLAWGEERLGTKIEIFIPIGINIIFLFINYLLSLFLYQKSPLLSRIISVATMLITLLTLIFIIRTILLII